MLLRKPLAPDAMWCVFHSESDGTFEWICGHERAAELLNGGMRSINGHPCHVYVVDEYPEIRGTHLCAWYPVGKRPELAAAA